MNKIKGALLLALAWIRQKTAEAFIWIIKPELAPMLGEMNNVINQIITRKVGWGDLEVLDNNFIKVDKELARKAGQKGKGFHGSKITKQKHR